MLRLDSGVFSRLKNFAQTSDKSINSVCTDFILNGLGHSHEKTHPVLQKLQEHFKSQLLGLVLFGSVSRGTERPSSDIDLLIVLAETIPIEGKLYRDWDNFSEGLSFEKYSPHFVHLPPDVLKSGSLWLEIALEGQVLFDTHGQVEQRLQHLRQLIAERIFKRDYAYGIPYWKKVA